MIDTLHHSLRKSVHAILPDVPADAVQLERPRNRSFGDVSLPCFRLAAALGKKPDETARHLADALPSISGIRAVNVAGPFVNFSLERAPFMHALHARMAKDKPYGSSQKGHGSKVLIEHTSINPNASPHIGRSRNALIGACLDNLYRFHGYDVETHYYVNNLGKQIALLVLICRDRPEPDFEEILDLYVQAHQRSKEEPAFEQAAFDLLEQFESGNTEVRLAFKRIIDICLPGQLAILTRLGIAYDVFDYESDYLSSPNMEAALATLEEKGALFTDKEDRLVVNLKPLGFPREEGQYYVVKRGNETTMYGYRDVAYTIAKCQRAQGTNLIVLGEDHKLYFQQLSTILRAVGFEPPEVVHYAFILLKEGKMSTRQGNVVLLSDFLDEAVARARKRIDAANADLSEKERAATAEAIGIAAVKFGILKVSPNSQVTFDWDAALSFEGDSGPYVQYTNARIYSVLRKYGQALPALPTDNFLINEEEWALVMHLAHWGRMADLALEQANPATLANYALEVARSFNSFYHRHNVLHARPEALRAFRLNLCSMTARVLETVLSLLGIETPERM